MRLVSWAPFQDITFNRLFDDAILGSARRSAGTSTWMPPADICETRNELVVTTDVPGADPKHITVSVENSVLRIRGERRFDQTPEVKHFHRAERSHGPFARSFTLATPVDADNVVANYKDGVLRISLPKSGQARPTRIQITAAV
jgi:HSP20 family protein